MAITPPGVLMPLRAFFDSDVCAICLFFTRRYGLNALTGIF